MNSILWISSDKKRPLCDVPWNGTTVVSSDGDVEFCCYSSGVIGNVNEASFGEIWNGEKMTKIRSALSEQRFPQECSTSSCPIYRGDKQNHILRRMDGEKTDYSHFSERLNESFMEISSENPTKLHLRIRSHGTLPVADLFVGVKSRGGLYFLPNFETFPVPLITIEENGSRMDFSFDLGMIEPGGLTVCAALFVPKSNPNILANCYWSQTRTFSVKRVTYSQTETYRAVDTP